MDFLISSKNKGPLFFLLSLFVIISPIFLQVFYIQFLTKIFIYIIFAYGLYLLVNLTGLVSLGHAIFFGFSGYCLYFFSNYFPDLNFIILFALSIFSTIIISVFVGLIVLKTRGLYFLMSTLAISQIFYYLFHDFDFSGGSDGVFINTIKPIDWFNLNVNFLGGTYSLFYLSLTFCFLSAALVIFISKSKLGLVLNAIRLNEEKVSALGYSVKNLKLSVFVLSAILSAIAGILFSLQFGYINPENLSWHLSVIVLIILIIGIKNGAFGPIIGSLCFLILELLLQGLTVYWKLFLGFFIIVITINNHKSILDVFNKKL